MKMNRIIWVLRELRCGGTWFVDKLSHTYYKKPYMFELVPEYKILSYEERRLYYMNRKESNDDYTRVLNTHDFCAVDGLKNYSNPIVFRVLRRNKTEQFLSLYLGKLGKMHYHVYDNKHIRQLPKYDPMIIPKKGIDQFLRESYDNERLWNSISNLYETETLYYEDLLDTFTSKILPDVKWSMNEPTNDRLPLKMPYDKRKIFLNYDDIEKAISALSSVD